MKKWTNFTDLVKISMFDWARIQMLSKLFIVFVNNKIELHMYVCIKVCSATYFPLILSFLTFQRINNRILYCCCLVWQTIAMQPVLTTQYILHFTFISCLRLNFSYYLHLSNHYYLLKWHTFTIFIEPIKKKEKKY